MMKISWIKAGLVSAALACTAAIALAATSTSSTSTAPTTASAKPETASAIFAGGCFWCSESDYEKLKGVTEVVSGYIGGKSKNPSYQEVSAGGTGHYEAVEVFYDPSVVSYDTLVNYFWSHHDYLDNGGQFCDRGSQYAPAIFPQDAKQLNIAKRSLAAFQQRVKAKIATKIVPASTFYAAEDYHQNYYKTNPVRYNYYRLSCGRDSRIDALKADLKPARN
ncbi:MAG: peptide-methionine (S)-S-oxide reductase MsrA [Paraperlucidibaca sp.]|jgi:peptide-methionine (S)-S-oxide reductase|nr:peptide-methionine (S)-S-oxide reductase MsrA [Paraperlucidibaca sp.]MBQ0722892.1 peptide-methionine (S)-S-oxide reductase MsrA [Paraperlucidibaca sp.]MBQ0842753.1 peptide-methionine (S)-S-oxide reductase MsrA [Paraperlucidibaca sp.]